MSTQARTSEEYLAGERTLYISMICSPARLVTLPHLIGRLASVVETFLVSSPEEQHASTTLLQEKHLLHIRLPGEIVNIIS